MTPIRLKNVRKHFGKTIAVDGVNLEIPGGDLFFLLGPSGCGKTTLLRMIAGFTEPTEGSIYFGDQDVTAQPTNKRDTGMVFQGYALWPHMSVQQNVGFGLTVGARKSKYSAAERQKKVEQTLELVQISHLAKRKINQLSGGQQQRVALARALVVEPSVLLLDEPLSNLDAKLRLEMRAEIRRVCKRAKITGVYVTHDQKEALSMADGMAVLNQGQVTQVGAPRALYERPDTRFVADFLGETNFITAQIQGRKTDAQGREVLELNSPLGILQTTAFDTDAPNAAQVTLSIRPEALTVKTSTTSTGPNHFVATRVDTIYLGETAQYRLKVNEQTHLKCLELNPGPVPEGDQAAVGVTVEPSDVVVLKD